MWWSPCKPATPSSNPAKPSLTSWEGLPPRAGLHQKPGPARFIFRFILRGRLRAWDWLARIPLVIISKCHPEQSEGSKLPGNMVSMPSAIV